MKGTKIVSEGRLVGVIVDQGILSLLIGIPCSPSYAPASLPPQVLNKSTELTDIFPWRRCHYARMGQTHLEVPAS